MDCGRRSAVDDDRSRKTRLAVDDDRRQGRWAVDDARSRIAFYQAQSNKSLDQVDRNLDRIRETLRSIRRMRMSSATIPRHSSSSIPSSASRRRHTSRHTPTIADDYAPLELPLKWRDPPPEYPPLELPLRWREPPPLKHAKSRSDMLARPMFCVGVYSDFISDETTAATTAQAKPAGLQNSQPRRSIATPTSLTAADQTPAHPASDSPSRHVQELDLSRPDPSRVDYSDSVGMELQLEICRLPALPVDGNKAVRVPDSAMDGNHSLIPHAYPHPDPTSSDDDGSAPQTPVQTHPTIADGILQSSAHRQSRGTIPFDPTPDSSIHLQCAPPEAIEQDGHACCGSTGEIPSEIGKLENLDTILLQVNDLTRELPSELEQLQSLKSMDLPKNTFTGLEEIQLWENNFSGSIPRLFGTTGQLRLLDRSLKKEEKLVEWSEPYLSNSRRMHCIMDPDADHGVGEINLTLLQNPIKQERRQKNRCLDDSGFEETRRINQLAFCYEEPVIPLEMFDDVLLCSCERLPQDVREIREKVYTEAGKDSKNSIPNESGVSRKSCWKKQLKEEVVDFNSFLLHCAHTMDNDDNLRGYEFLKKIQQHSSPHDNASLRLAHYFANSLQARLAGTGREVHLKQISILNAGYAWIATDWLSSVLDYSGSADPVTMSLIQGAIVLHPHTPDSNIKQNFLSRWNKLLQKGYVSSSLNSYGLYAYDTVWLVAYAKFLNEGGIVSFSHNPRLSNVNGSSLSAILHACAILKVLGDGLLVQGCAIHHGFTPFVYVYNGLVNMHAKCGDIESASKVFDEMKAKEFGVVFAYVGARPPNQLCLVGFGLEKASEVGFENDLHRILLAPTLKWVAFIDFLLALRDKYAVASTHGGMQNSGRPKQLIQLMNEIVDIHRRRKIFDPGGWHISTESSSFDARGE